MRESTEFRFKSKRRAYHRPPPDDQEEDRREFLKRMVQGGLVLGGGVAGAYLLEDPTGLEQPPKPIDVVGEGSRFLTGIERSATLPEMAIATGRPLVAGEKEKVDYGRLIDAAIGELGGIGRFVKKGESVLIKPNVAFDRPPRLGATTHPDTMRAVVRLCREAGAREVLVADNPINSPEGAFVKSGVGKAAEEAGARILLPRPESMARIMLPPGQSEVLDVWTMFYEPIARVDRVIGLAPIKDHNLCSASMSLKNWYGLLAGARNRFHQSIHEIVADFALMMKPTLVILDATRVLMRNGPTGGSTADVKEGNTVIAGFDSIAIDSYGYTNLLGRDLSKLGGSGEGYLQKAQRRGLGTMDWKSLNPKTIRI